MGTGFDAALLLRLAASPDQASHHVVARALVGAARERHIELEMPGGVREEPGAGIEGLVAGRALAAGGWDFVRRELRTRPWRTRSGSGFSAAERSRSMGVLAGALLLGDDQTRDWGGHRAAACGGSCSSPATAGIVHTA